MEKYAKRFLTLLCVMFLAGTLLPGMRAEAGAKKDALKAYSSLLETKDTGSYGFALAYIDGDGVPELVFDDTIYSYKNGSIQSVTKLGWSNCMLQGFYKKTGIIDVFYAHANIYGSIHWDYYYKYSKGKCKQKLTKSIYNDSNGSATGYYNAKDNSISKTKFQRQLKKLVGTKKMTKFKYYKNTAANRKKYLK